MGSKLDENAGPSREWLSTSAAVLAQRGEKTGATSPALPNREGTGRVGGNRQAKHGGSRSSYAVVRLDQSPLERGMEQRERTRNQGLLKGAKGELLKAWGALC